MYCHGVGAFVHHPSVCPCVLKHVCLETKQFIFKVKFCGNVPKLPYFQSGDMVHVHDVVWVIFPSPAVQTFFFHFSVLRFDFSLFLVIFVNMGTYRRRNFL